MILAAVIHQVELDRFRDVQKTNDSFALAVNILINTAFNHEARLIFDGKEAVAVRST
jgi:hypothetical protein